jgi:predicted DNA binding CopG/RHH family protein
MKQKEEVKAAMTKKHEEQHQHEPIPHFESVEEEAAFWETHDIADYWEEAKPVKVRFAKNLSEGLHIRLDPESLKELRTLAHEKGIGPTTLVRMWVMEHLREDQRNRTAS